MKITRAAIIKANQELIRNNGKARELTPLEQYANSIIENKSDEFVSKETKEEFKKLNQYEQNKLLIMAKLRKHIKEFFADREKVNKAFKDAMDKVLKNTNYD